MCFKMFLQHPPPIDFDRIMILSNDLTLNAIFFVGLASLRPLPKLKVQSVVLEAITQRVSALDASLV